MRPAACPQWAAATTHNVLTRHAAAFGHGAHDSLLWFVQHLGSELFFKCQDLFALCSSTVSTRIMVLSSIHLPILAIRVGHVHDNAQSINCMASCTQWAARKQLDAVSQPVLPLHVQLQCS